MTTQHGYPQLTGAQCLSYALKTLRADFLAQPPETQAETLDRVRRLLEAEARRGQNQPSYLALHAHEIYGSEHVARLGVRGSNTRSLATVKGGSGTQTRPDK